MVPPSGDADLHPPREIAPIDVLDVGGGKADRAQAHGGRPHAGLLRRPLPRPPARARATTRSSSPRDRSRAAGWRRRRRSAPWRRPDPRAPDRPRRSRSPRSPAPAGPGRLRPPRAARSGPRPAARRPRSDPRGTRPCRPPGRHPRSSSSAAAATLIGFFPRAPCGQGERPRSRRARRRRWIDRLGAPERRAPAQQQRARHQDRGAQESHYQNFVRFVIRHLPRDRGRSSTPRATRAFRDRAAAPRSRRATSGSTGTDRTSPPATLPS